MYFRPSSSWASAMHSLALIGLLLISVATCSAYSSVTDAELSLIVAKELEHQIALEGLQYVSAAQARQRSPMGHSGSVFKKNSFVAAEEFLQTIDDPEQGIKREPTVKVVAEATERFRSSGEQRDHAHKVPVGTSMNLGKTLNPTRAKKTCFSMCMRVNLQASLSPQQVAGTAPANINPVKGEEQFRDSQCQKLCVKTTVAVINSIGNKPTLPAKTNGLAGDVTMADGKEGGGLMDYPVFDPPCGKVDDVACNGHGKCEQGKCICDTNYDYTEVCLPTRCPFVNGAQCNGKGVCLLGGICKCEESLIFTGKNCELMDEIGGSTDIVEGYKSADSDCNMHPRYYRSIDSSVILFENTNEIGPAACAGERPCPTMMQSLVTHIACKRDHYKCPKQDKCGFENFVALVALGRSDSLRMCGSKTECEAKKGSTFQMWGAQSPPDLICPSPICRTEENGMCTISAGGLYNCGKVLLRLSMIQEGLTQMRGGSDNKNPSLIFTNSEAMKAAMDHAPGKVETLSGVPLPLSVYEVSTKKLKGINLRDTIDLSVLEVIIESPMPMPNTTTVRAAMRSGLIAPHPNIPGRGARGRSPANGWLYDTLMDMVWDTHDDTRNDPRTADYPSLPAGTWQRWGLSTAGGEGFDPDKSSPHKPEYRNKRLGKNTYLQQGPNATNEFSGVTSEYVFGGYDHYKKHVDYPGGGGFMCSDTLASAIMDKRVGPGFTVREKPSDYGVLEAAMHKMLGLCMAGELGCVESAEKKKMCHLGVKDTDNLVCCSKDCGMQCGADPLKCGKPVNGHDLKWAKANCCQDALFAGGIRCLKPEDSSCALSIDGNGDHTNTVPGDRIPNPNETLENAEESGGKDRRSGKSDPPPMNGEFTVTGAVKLMGYLGLTKGTPFKGNFDTKGLYADKATNRAYFGTGGTIEQMQAPVSMSGQYRPSFDGLNNYWWACDDGTSYASFDAQFLNPTQKAMVQQKWPGKPGSYYALVQSGRLIKDCHKKGLGSLAMPGAVA